MSLVDDVSARLSRDRVGPVTESLIWGAFSDRLEEALDGGVVPPTISPGEPSLRPRGSFLKSLTVSGFRGIGRETSLTFAPEPGLVLITGRNGSGKSSFSEALEVLLTGDSSRWRNRPKVWAQGWRNLHDGDDPHIHAVFTSDGPADQIEVVTEWDTDSVDVGACSSLVQLLGLPGKANLNDIGWTQALDLYQPILPHSEVEAVLSDGPTVLYDAITAVLALEPLLEAANRLRAVRLAEQAHEKKAKKGLPLLLKGLGQIEDARGRRVLKALDSKHWDLSAVEQALAGDPKPKQREDISLLRDIAGLEIPDPAKVEATASHLQDVFLECERLRATDAGQARDVANLLIAARKHYEGHGDTTCPVCQDGDLNRAWAEHTERRVAELEHQASELDRASQALAEADEAVRRYLAPIPAALHRPEDSGIDASPALAAWKAWLAAPNTPGELVAHVRAQLSTFRTAVEEVSRLALKEYERREDAWTPIAVHISDWLETAYTARAAQRRIAEVAKAENWLKDTTIELREERFDPISGHVRHLWSALRLDSSVDITKVVLDGKGNSRHLTLGATVDNKPALAQSVMSQGELNCLSLSLFLPRATLDESPFRFVVIDDPVQAMDPSRVDGLARVFAELANSRQVIIFTHDDRLAEAAHRLNLQASLQQIARRPGSLIEVRKQ